jgi:membrane protein
VSRLVRHIADAFVEHNLLTYAAAVAFQALVACVPLSLLGLGLLGALGLDNVWSDSVAPALHGRVTPAVYHAIDDTARRVLHNGSAGVIAFSGLLSIWYLAAAMRAVMEALNAIHDVHDPRPWWRRALLAVALGIGCGAALVGSILIVTAAPRVGGGMDAVADVGRWLVALVLLMTAVALLVRFAPAEHPQPRWASAGSILVVCSWIVASLVFRWLVGVANFKSPTGSLTALLMVTGYLFVSSTVFLVGVQLDETLRRETGGRARGLLNLARRG